jgi:hypothetical protein
VTPDEAAGIGVALNESTLLDASVDPAQRTVELVVDVLSLPPEGPPPQDARVFLRVLDVGRIACRKLRGGAPVPMRLEELAQTVRGGAGRPMYGWEFVDPPIEEPCDWSLDWRAPTRAMGVHRLSVFQEWSLDLWIWFDRLEVRTFAGVPVSLTDFVAGGKRWWDGLHAGDPRTANRGILPAG